MSRKQLGTLKLIIQVYMVQGTLPAALHKEKQHFLMDQVHVSRLSVVEDCGKTVHSLGAWFHSTQLRPIHPH